MDYTQYNHSSCSEHRKVIYVPDKVPQVLFFVEIESLIGLFDSLGMHHFVYENGSIYVFHAYELR